jgi:hypothetical protein
MIGCPHCGTLNRRGSKYCGNCGERLDTVPSIHCPSCNGPNPIDSPLCEFCGAALVSPAEEGDTGLQPPSPSPEEPAEPEASEPAASSRPELPGWLYPRPAEQPERPDLSAGAPSPTPAEPPVEQEGNKHLRGIRGVLPTSDGWLSASLSRYLSSAAESGETLEPNPGLESSAG